ncbi:MULTISPECIES: ABC transporter ATP-binding protein [Paenibacillus]|uniref:ATP-binding cassette domain-containing protein n=1 Tax=Paenibacillus validus TaxID=44253 RepID=A0A7X2ZBW0_9BACL|nr:MULTISPECIES: ABC transporter ATP-binding protein [Paenibacillus]MUG71266.1 ATP-binding cassette domain-containing protein [Paenibacillus validus]
MLTVSDLHMYYGGVHALKGVSLEVNEGEVVAVIGSNGAGKTTLLSAILGMVKPRSGQISYSNQDITYITAHKTVNMGISLVPEGREVFSSMTVYENLRLGLKKRVGRVNQKEFDRELEHIFFRFPRLKERIDQLAGTLSGGEQQMMVISRALIGKPKLLLLDEPSLGLAPIIVNEIFDIIKGLKQDGMTIILVEQMANKALSVADRGYVLENGHIAMSGTAKELRGNREVAKAYLGVS